MAGPLLPGDDGEPMPEDIGDCGLCGGTCECPDCEGEDGCDLCSGTGECPECG